MKQVRFLALFLIILSLQAEAQRQPFPLAPRPQPSGPEARSTRTNATLRVLALLVEFQADDDPRTSGTGQFLQSGSPNQIDPPPHDTTYFASKLRFLENYFSKVSNGALTIEGELFPQTIVLADTMAVYSPRQGETNLPLANLMVDAWSAAGAAAPSFPFNLYDAFIIFHAGAGRDIDLVSFFGFDPTPNDIPSLFIGLSSLREFLGNPAYQGIPVNGGSFFITNSIILPETETRVFTSGSQVDTLQLSINGMLAASFGSYLGLPDLFNTQTGRSGIGQFGLMDGAAIFAFNGLFPPEPSAWEKIYLGWTTPITIAAGSLQLSIPAVGLTQSGIDTVYKVPISSAEYFLIENRNRDPEGDGQTLSILQQGQIVTRHFEKDTAGFVFYDVSGISGSLVDAQNFDWAVPGSSLDEGFEGGGILIWHIDEHDLSARIAANTLNADPNDRSVDLEEADGSQDIGQDYPFLDPGSGTEFGWPLDFWFQGNLSSVYTNAFRETSFPDSRAKSGATSLVTINDFGPVAPRMVVSVTQGNARLARMFRSQEVPDGGQAHITVTDSGIYFAGPNRIFAIRSDGSPRTNDPAGVIDVQGSTRALAVREGNPAFAVGALDSSLVIWELADTNSNGLFDLISRTIVDLGEPVTSYPVLIDSAGTSLALIGTFSGKIARVLLTGTISSLRSVDTSPIRSIVWFPPSPGFVNGSVVASSENGVFHDQGFNAPLSRSNTMISGIRFNGTDRIFAANPENGFSGFDSQLSATPGSFKPGEVLPGRTLVPFYSIVPGDLDKDSRLDVVASNGDMLVAVNESGNLLDGFPVSSSAGFTGTPLLADIDGDAQLEILLLANDGTLNAFRGDGRPASGFPVQITVPQSNAPALFRTPDGKIGIVVPSGEGAVDGWELNQALSGLQGAWLQSFANSAHTGVSLVNPTGTQPISATFLPPERVYNWPNPVYGSTTRIRYYTSAAAKISITILTLAGETVTKLTGDSPGGVDGEIPWDVSNIQSGIYFARVEANGGGRIESAIIKIAVVK